MSEVRCESAMAALLRIVEEGGSLSDETRAHLQSCARCRAIFAAARDVEQTLAAEGAAATASDRARPSDDLEIAASRETERLRRGRVTARAVLIAVAVILFASIVFVAMRGDSSADEVLLVVFATAVMATPILIIIGIARLGRRAHAPLYKRIGPGRQLSGVCLGLAERTGWPVAVFRIIFVGLLFANGFGLLLYILFDLAMPVHPGDREHLLRFRIRRFFSSLRRRASAG